VTLAHVYRVACSLQILLANNQRLFLGSVVRNTGNDAKNNREQKLLVY
jgi:hypothetical protein